MIYMEWQKDLILNGNAIPLSQKTKLADSDYEGLARRIGYKGVGITVNLPVITSQADVIAPPDILTRPPIGSGPIHQLMMKEGQTVPAGPGPIHQLMMKEGQTGPRGPAGPRGPRGFTGPQGIPGEIGSVGPQGTRGETGVAGSTGAIGASGVVGPRGPMGATGQKGDSASYAMSLIDPPRFKPASWPIQTQCRTEPTYIGQTQPGASKPVLGKPAMNGALPGGQIPFATCNGFCK